jgi:dienelactone hydrolase
MRADPSELGYVSEQRVLSGDLVYGDFERIARDDERFVLLEMHRKLLQRGLCAKELMVTGWTRAGALAVLFAPSRGSLQSTGLAVPQYVFAAADEAGNKSQRPIETVSVVAQRLNLVTDANYTATGGTPS